MQNKISQCCMKIIKKILIWRNIFSAENKKYRNVSYSLLWLFKGYLKNKFTIKNWLLSHYKNYLLYKKIKFIQMSYSYSTVSLVPLYVCQNKLKKKFFLNIFRIKPYFSNQFYKSTKVQKNNLFLMNLYFFFSNFFSSPELISRIQV